jgi:hypothetical protein
MSITAGYQPLPRRQKNKLKLPRRAATVKKNRLPLPRRDRRNGSGSAAMDISDQ